MNCRTKGLGGVFLRGLTLTQQIAWGGSIAAHLVLIIRLYRFHSRNYHWFITYLAIALLGTFYLWSVPVRSARYTTAWIIVQFVTLFFLYAAALEIYTGLVRHFGGVDQRGKIASYLGRVLNALMALSLVICIAFSAFDARALDTSFFSLGSALATTVLLKRIATSSLAIFLAGSALYFARFRIALPPNLRLHGLLFTVWMAVSAAALFWRNLDAPSAYVINIVFLSSTVLIFFLWIIGMKKSGESLPMYFSISESSAAADREILVSFLKKLTRQR